jgi:hypothetical protein
MNIGISTRELLFFFNSIVKISFQNRKDGLSLSETPSRVWNAPIWPQTCQRPVLESNKLAILFFCFVPFFSSSILPIFSSLYPSFQNFLILREREILLSPWRYCDVDSIQPREPTFFGFQFFTLFIRVCFSLFLPNFIFCFLSFNCAPQGKNYSLSKVFFKVVFVFCKIYIIFR